MNTCYLNGDYIDLKDAKVSALDRGFIFGEGVYEVIEIYQGKVFAWQRHLDRLQDSLDDLGIVNPLSEEEWLVVIERLIVLNKCISSIMYIQITRGSAPRAHEFPTSDNPTIFVMITSSKFSNGLELVSAITAEDERWKRCYVKTTSLYANTKLHNLARNQGGQETILRRSGFVTEGASSNVFVVCPDGIVYTTPLWFNILPGVTRGLIVEFAEALGVSVLEQKISLDMLKAAREIWLTSTSSGIRCVSSLDSKIVGNGIDYPVAQRFKERLVFEKKLLAS